MQYVNLSGKNQFNVGATISHHQRLWRMIIDKTNFALHRKLTKSVPSATSVARIHTFEYRNETNRIDLVLLVYSSYTVQFVSPLNFTLFTEFSCYVASACTCSWANQPLTFFGNNRVIKLMLNYLIGALWCASVGVLTSQLVLSLGERSAAQWWRDVDKNEITRCSSEDNQIPRPHPEMKTSPAQLIWWFITKIMISFTRTPHGINEEHASPPVTHKSQHVDHVTVL